MFVKFFGGQVTGYTNKQKPIYNINFISLWIRFNKNISHKLFN